MSDCGPACNASPVVMFLLKIMPIYNKPQLSRQPLLSGLYLVPEGGHLMEVQLFTCMWTSLNFNIPLNGAVLYTPKLPHPVA